MKFLCCHRPRSCLKSPSCRRLATHKHGASPTRSTHLATCRCVAATLVAKAVAATSPASFCQRRVVRWARVSSKIGPATLAAKCLPTSVASRGASMADDQRHNLRNLTNDVQPLINSLGAIRCVENHSEIIGRKRFKTNFGLPTDYASVVGGEQRRLSRTTTGRQAPWHTYEAVHRRNRITLNVFMFARLPSHMCKFHTLRLCGVVVDKCSRLCSHLFARDRARCMSVCTRGHSIWTAPLRGATNRRTCPDASPHRNLKTQRPHRLSPQHRSTHAYPATSTLCCEPD